MGQQFHFLTGDVNFTDYGGKWYRQIGPAQFHVIELQNWEDLCGERGPEGSTYNVSLAEVDIGNPERLAESLQSSGWVEDECNDLMKVEAMHGHGAKAPLAQWNGSNYKHLLAEAKQQSRVIMASPENHEAAMNRKVNNIGSTAKEYQDGDIASAILRGVEREDPAAELMLKLGVS